MDKIDFGKLSSRIVNVVYHKNCLDGLFAAGVMRSVLEHHNLNAQYIPCQYGEDLELPDDAVNIFVDFSLKNIEMRSLIEKSFHTYVLDHHTSANTELVTLPEEYPNFTFIFDNDVCGTEVVYNTLVKDRISDLNINEKLIKHVTDWDLFLFKLPETAAIKYYVEYLTSKKDLDKAFEILTYTDAELDSFIEAGNVLNNFIWKRANKVSKALEKKEVAPIKLGHHKIMGLNQTSDLSEVGNSICDRHQLISMGYFITDEQKVICSLRSLNSLPDAGKICEFFGGGGHRNACGFQIPLELLPTLLNDGYKDVVRLDCLAKVNDDYIKGFLYTTSGGVALHYSFNGKSETIDTDKSITIDYKNIIKL